MSDKCVLISQTLQNNWSLQSPAVGDINWQTTRVDTAAFPTSGKNYTVACYNPAGALQNEPQSREAWLQNERVVIDIIVRVLSTPAAAADVRESMRGEIYRILHGQQFQVPGVADAIVEREGAKVESPDLARLTLQVVCRSFHLSS
jgi:hypothetical protein